MEAEHHPRSGKLTSLIHRSRNAVMGTVRRIRSTRAVQMIHTNNAEQAQLHKDQLRDRAAALLKPRVRVRVVRHAQVHRDLARKLAQQEDLAHAQLADQRIGHKNAGQH